MTQCTITKAPQYPQAIKLQAIKLHKDEEKRIKRKRTVKEHYITEESTSIQIKSF